MRIPFYKIYKYFWKTFDVSDDAKLIDKLKKEKKKEAIVVKRSWLYWLAISWILIITLFVSFFNVYNLYKSFIISWNQTLWYIMIGLLLYSTTMLILSSFYFIYNFRKTYWKWNNIEPIEKVIEELNNWDDLFIKFFNQITTNLFLFYILIVIYIVFIIFQIVNIWELWYSLIYSFFDISLLFLQIWLMKYYRKKMIDLEFDFNIITPWMLYFINQSNMSWSTQTLKSEKIKTIKDVSWQNFIMSFFNLWNIIVLTEWDQWWNWTMDMFFVDNPKETVKNIYTLMNKEEFSIKNKYFKKILNILKIEDLEYDSIESIVKIKWFLKENELTIKNDFVEWDIEVKEEIKEMYKLVWFSL